MKRMFGFNIPNKYADRIEDIETLHDAREHDRQGEYNYCVWFAKPYVDSTDDPFALKSIRSCSTKQEVMQVIRDATTIDPEEWDRRFKYSWKH